jgi:hypothetical protein
VGSTVHLAGYFVGLLVEVARTVRHPMLRFQVVCGCMGCQISSTFVRTVVTFSLEFPLRPGLYRPDHTVGPACGCWLVCCFYSFSITLCEYVKDQVHENNYQLGSGGTTVITVSVWLGIESAVCPGEPLNRK